MSPHQVLWDAISGSSVVGDAAVITERPEFLDLSRGLGMHIAALDPDSLHALLQQDYVKDQTITVEKALAAGSALLGERIDVNLSGGSMSRRTAACSAPL